MLHIVLVERGVEHLLPCTKTSHIISPIIDCIMKVTWHMVFGLHEFYKIKKTLKMICPFLKFWVCEFYKIRNILMTWAFTLLRRWIRICHFLKIWVHTCMYKISYIQVGYLFIKILVPYWLIPLEASFKWVASFSKQMRYFINDIQRYIIIFI